MTPTQTLLIFALLLGGAVVVIIYFVSSQLRELKNKDSEKVLLEWLKSTQSSFENQLKNQSDTMSKQTKMIGDRLDNAAKVIGNVQRQLGGLEKFGRDVEDLSHVLKSPKLRGGLGEQFLYEILENFLPKDLYKKQYKFRDGSICDAVIVTEKGLIPVDSKFSLENFKAMLGAESEDARAKLKKEFVKDVKKRIDEISSKYILPEEGTTDQAIMYIPSENIYYELVVNTPDIEEYAQNKSVLMTSPNTFTYFVKIVMVAYQQNELAEHAGEILKSLAGIRVEAEKFDGELGVLDGHITRTTKSMDNVKSKYGKLFGKISAVQEIGKEESRLLKEKDQT